MSSYNKLIRDKIPEIIEADGKTFRVRTLDEQEFQQELRTKLQEEVSEYLEAEDNESALEELADILEVVNALAEVHGFSIEQLEQVRVRKVDQRGGFQKKLFLIDVDK
jgi:predicted house-cleaning noncanonical NTP pyrophosphatase (MazG superfamily)